MKSARLTFICCCISGIMLLFMGIFLLSIDTTVTPQSPNVSQPSQNTTGSDTANNYITSGDPINFLVLIKEASGDNTDSIMIINYAPDTRQISLLTVPRDTKPAVNASFKINSAYYLGLKKYGTKEVSEKEQKQKAAEYAAQYISNLTGITLDYYAYFEIDTIKEIIDRLGGVYFDVPADLRYSDPAQDLYIDLKKGYQLLNGDKAEQLLRFRKTHNLSKASADLRKYYDGSDLKRTEMQVRFINEFIKQKVTLLNLTKFIPIINYTFDNVITNISLSDMLSLFGGFTQSSKPEMKTFKLYGVDKRIDSIDYFVYTNKIEDTKTNDIFSSREIINQYFGSKTGLITPNKKYDYNSILNSNPSNSETDTSGDGTDKP